MHYVLCNRLNALNGSIIRKFVNVIFEIEHSCDYLATYCRCLATSWSSGEKVIKIIDKTFWQKKPCWQTKDNMPECSSKWYQYIVVKFELNSRRTRHRQTWKTLFLEKGLWTKMVGNITSIRQTNVHYIYIYIYTYITCVRATEIEV